MMKSNQPTARRNDLLLIGGLLLLAAAALVWLFCFRPAGGQVEITIDGEPYKTFALSQEITEEIHSGEGATNILIIREGKAQMQSASCPDGICVDHAPIFREGESIVCLPNRVVVTVTAAGEDMPDAVI